MTWRCRAMARRRTSPIKPGSMRCQQRVLVLESKYETLTDRLTDYERLK